MNTLTACIIVHSHKFILYSELARTLCRDGIMLLFVMILYHYLYTLLKRDHIGIKDEQCDETYEKIIFRFSIFEIWSILYSQFLEK